MIAVSMTLPGFDYIPALATKNKLSARCHLYATLLLLLLLHLFLACLHGLDMPALVSLHLILPRQEGVEAVARVARPRPRPPECSLRRVENRLHRMLVEIDNSFSIRLASSAAVRGWRETNRSHIGQITIYLVDHLWQDLDTLLIARCTGRSSGS